MRCGNSRKRLLRRVECRLVNDRGMRLRGVVLRKLAVIPDPLLFDMIVDICFLKQRVARVFFVTGKVANPRGIPFSTESAMQSIASLSVYMCIFLNSCSLYYIFLINFYHRDKNSHSLVLRVKLFIEKPLSF